MRDRRESGGMQTEGKDPVVLWREELTRVRSLVQRMVALSEEERQRAYPGLQRLMEQTFVAHYMDGQWVKILRQDFDRRLAFETLIAFFQNTLQEAEEAGIPKSAKRSEKVFLVHKPHMIAPRDITMTIQGYGLDGGEVLSRSEIRSRDQVDNSIYRLSQERMRREILRHPQIRQAVHINP